MTEEAAIDEDGDTELSDTEADLEPTEDSSNDQEELLKQNAGYLEDLQRIQAEFDNFRRQTTKRQTDLVEQAASSLVEKLLPILDACDAAIQQGAEDVSPIRNALIEILQSSGLEVVSLPAVVFDPERHESVMHDIAEESEETTVEEIMRSGYLWKGRTIRPAMVRTKGPA